MSKIEFYHDTRRGTAAVELPEGGELADFITHWVRSSLEKKPTKMLKIGLAKLHPEDQLEKSIGREIAIKNMDYLDFTLDYIHSQQKYLIVGLRAKDLLVVLLFRSIEKRPFLRAVVNA